jgi:hypothetical protein
MLHLLTFQEATGLYGVQEVLLASFIAAGTAAFFGAQPLLISGVTGSYKYTDTRPYHRFQQGHLSDLSGSTELSVSAVHGLGVPLGSHLALYRSLFEWCVILSHILRACKSDK